MAKKFGEVEKTKEFEADGKSLRFRRVWSGKGMMKLEAKKKAYRARGFLVRSEREERGHYALFIHKA